MPSVPPLFFTRPNFIKLLSRKYCLTNFLAKQNLSWAPATTTQTSVTWDKDVNLFLLSNSLRPKVLVLSGFMKLGTFLNFTGLEPFGLNFYFCQSAAPSNTFWHGTSKLCTNVTISAWSSPESKTCLDSIYLGLNLAASSRISVT